MSRLTDKQRHPLRIAAADARGEIGWLGPLNVERGKWLRFMRSLSSRGWFTYLGFDTFQITDAGRAALKDATRGRGE